MHSALGLNDGADSAGRRTQIGRISLVGTVAQQKLETLVSMTWPGPWGNVSMFMQSEGLRGSSESNECLEGW